MMRAYLSTGNTTIWPFENVARFGSSRPSEGVDLYGYGKGLNKPVYTECGGFVFFTDSANKLWKYDGTGVYPVGLANEQTFTNHKIKPRQVVNFPVCMTATGNSLNEVGQDLILNVSDYVEIYPDMLEHAVNEGPFKHSVAWVRGFPFKVDSAAEQQDGSWNLHLHFFTDDYFYFPYDHYKNWDSAPLHAGIGLGTIAFSQEYDTHWCDFLFDNRLISDSGEVNVDGYSPGNLDGEYEWCITLVTKHGYESNWCGPFLYKIDKGQARILLSWAENLYLTGDFLNYSPDYIKSIRLYRTFRDAPGAWYFVVEVPFESTAGGNGWYNWAGYQGWYGYGKAIIIDNVPDEALGEALHSWKLTPTEAISLASTKNTLAVAMPNGIYVSEPTDPETFYNWLSFAGEVVAVSAIPYFDEIIVWCKNAIYAVNIFDFSTKAISSGIGLVGKNAQCILNDRVVFMSPGGTIYQYSGGRPEPIPGFEKIADLLWGKSNKRKINRLHYGSTFFIHNAKEREIWMVFGEDGMFGNIAIVHQLDSPVYRIYKFPWNIVCGICFENAGDQVTLLADENGIIYSFNSWTKADNGMTIPVLLESTQFGPLTDQLRIRQLYAEVIAKTDITFRMSGNYDRDGWISEGTMTFPESDKGHEKYLNTYPHVVTTYQFKLEEESIDGWQLQRFTLILQPKDQRIRPWR